MEPAIFIAKYFLRFGIQRTHLQFINTIKNISTKFIAVADGNGCTFQQNCGSWLGELQPAGWNPLGRQAVKTTDTHTASSAFIAENQKECGGKHKPEQTTSELIQHQPSDELQSII